jgi:hypothetical protein
MEGPIEEIADGEVLWRFDTAFLRSKWTCIWGRGCLGILPEPSPELGQGCCSVGAEFEDEDEARMIGALGATLDPERFQYHAEAQAGSSTARAFSSTDRVSAVVLAAHCTWPPWTQVSGRRIGNRRSVGSCPSKSIGRSLTGAPRLQRFIVGRAPTGARRGPPWRGAAPRVTERT